MALDSRDSPYAPIAMRDEPWWQISRRAAQQGDVGPDGTSWDESIRRLAMRVMYTPDLGKLLASPTPTPEARAVHEQFAAAMELPPLVGQYELNGRQIFDMSSGLVELLQHTDIRDCSFRDLQLPFPALYLHFGRQAGIKVVGPTGQPEYIDGALVGHAKTDDKEVLRFALSSVDETGARVRRPFQYLYLPSQALQLPVGEAIRAGVEDFLVGPRREDIPEWVSQFWEDNRRYAGEAAIAALPLIVNGLFYLENPPRPHRIAMGAGTPAEVIAQWERTPVHRRRKLASKLNADGYTLVHLVGEEISCSTDTAGDRSVAPHWRRGHWREQPHGPRLSLRKRILIKPVLVKARDVADPFQVPGHIYKPAEDAGAAS